MSVPGGGLTPEELAILEELFGSSAGLNRELVEAQIERMRAEIEAARGKAEADAWYQRAQIKLQQAQLALQERQAAAQLGGPSNYFQYADFLASGRERGSQRADMAGLSGTRPRALYAAPADERSRPPAQSEETLRRQIERGRPVGARYNAAGERIRYGGGGGGGDGRGGGGGGGRDMRAAGAAPAAYPADARYLPNAAALAAASPYNVYMRPEPARTPIRWPIALGPLRVGPNGESLGPTAYADRARSRAAARDGGGGGGGDWNSTDPNADDYYNPGPEYTPEQRARRRAERGGRTDASSGGEPIGFGGLLEQIRGRPAGATSTSAAPAVKDPRKAALEALVKAYNPSGEHGLGPDDIVALDTMEAVAEQGVRRDDMSPRERRRYRRDMPTGGYAGQRGLGGLGKGLTPDEKAYTRQVRDMAQAGPHTWGNQALESMSATERALMASALRRLGHDPEALEEIYARSRIGNQGAMAGMA